MTNQLFANQDATLEGPRSRWLHLVNSGRDAIENWAAPLVFLAIRIWLFGVFFRAGLVKIADWDATLFLFAAEYQVPLLSPELAAFLATGVELLMPALLLLGLLTRVAAVPLAVLTAVIQFVLGGTNPTYDNSEHIYWLLLLCVLISRGPGTLSVDAMLRWLAGRGAGVRG